MEMMSQDPFIANHPFSTQANTDTQWDSCTSVTSLWFEHIGSHGW